MSRTQSVQERADRRVRAGLAWTGLDTWVSPDRVLRALGYGGIGVTGIGVDMALVWLLAQFNVQYIPLTIISYKAAMTWNFVWQRRYVFESTGESLLTEYKRYLVVDVTALFVRLGVVTAVMELSLLAPVAGRFGVAQIVPASLLGIVVAFAVGFVATDEYVFESASGG